MKQKQAKVMGNGAASDAEYGNFSEIAHAAYSRAQWPRSVWVSELIPLTWMNEPGRRRVIGEFVSDPTSNRYVRPFLAIRMPGVVFDVQTEEFTPIPNDVPYSFGSGESYPVQMGKTW